MYKIKERSLQMQSWTCICSAGHAWQKRSWKASLYVEYVYWLKYVTSSKETNKRVQLPPVALLKKTPQVINLNKKTN